MLDTLTKAQKKTARALIDIALERDCAALIDEVSCLAQKPLDKVEKPNHARYIELYKVIESFDKHLADRYDGITGSKYLDTVSFLLAEGSLTDEDLTVCDETMKSELLRVKEILLDIRNR